MRHHRIIFHAASLCAISLLLAGSLAACGDDDSGSVCAANLLPGDLVITEVMPNPEGSDDGLEWFEVYNATSAPIVLRGVTLAYSRADGTGRKTHVIDAGTIPPGDYVVFGGRLEAAPLPYMDYYYADDLGSLTNTGGRLAIECNSTIVDEIVYVEATSGVSLSYDGRLVPDAQGNDVINDWCDSQTEFVTDNLGTPGEANDACDSVNPTGKCLDNGSERDIVPPTAGSVVITELMPNPSAAPDSDGEWFEVYFAQAADLIGLELGKEPGTVSFTVGGAECRPVAAGTYVLFALSDDNGLNGGLPPVDMVFDGLTLSNSGGSLFVGYDGAVLDQIAYTGSMVADGASTSLDGDILDAIQNDDATSWCEGLISYGAGDLGTPGEANPSCSYVPPVTCVDPITSTEREVSPPLAGDVVITEIMANPAAVSDGAGEGFEVYFAQDADLNGLQLGRADNPTATTIESVDCIRVTAGTYVVFARNTDPLANGGLPEAEGPFGFALTNSNQTVVVGFADVILDQVYYASSSSGVAASLSATALDPALNDAPGAWCDAAATYGDGDLGSPGQANPTCP